MKKTRIIAFSGFLGDPSDWDFWRAFLPDSYELETYLAKPEENESCDDWCARFLLEDKNLQPSILVGYSLGGRVASQLLICNPRRFKGLIAISTHPGLQNAKEREDRILSDRIWANRFAPQSGEDWNRLLKDWDSQPVFQRGLGTGSAPFTRHESDELKIRSQRQLLQMGLGTQPDLRGPLIESKIPQIWASGALDQKFSALASQFSQLSDLQNHSPKTWVDWRSVSEVGHRFLWQLPPEQSAKILNQWIGELDEKASQ